MTHLLILIFSFFPINRNIDNMINPDKRLDIISFFSENSNNFKDSLDISKDSKISYDLSFNKQFKDDNLDIFSLENSFYERYRNKDIFLSLNYKNSRDYVSYNDKEEDINFMRDIKTNKLEFKTGFFLKNFSFLGIFNINSNKTLNPGIYLDYFNNSKKLKYRIFYSNYKKQDYEFNKLIYKENLYNFKNNFIQNYNLLGFNLLVDFFKFNFKTKRVWVKSLNIAENFSFNESAKKNIYRLSMKFNFENYLIYLNYFEEIITADSKGELENVKYFKLSIKEYYNKIYKLGFKFKKITNLEFSFMYQFFDSYFFGNVEAWPFTDNSTVGWVGGRVNFTSKLNYNRFILKIKNRISIGKYLIVSPNLSFDRIIIYPDTTTYEAGIFGIGKRNIVNYKKRKINSYIHISSLFKLKGNDYSFNLFLSQIIPIFFTSGGTPSNKVSNTFGGFSLKFFMEYIF